MTASTSPPSRDDDPALGRLTAFGALDDNELQGLLESVSAERTIAANDTLWREAARPPGLFLLTEGWMASQPTDAEGNQRTIKVHLPGDMLGLPSLAFEAAGETMIALTPSRARSMRLHSFGGLFAAQPRLAAMIFLVSQQERMDLTDRLVDFRATNISVRVATTIVQLVRRIEIAFPGQSRTARLPITTGAFADLAGMSLSKFLSGLKELRDANIVSWRHQRLTVIDAARLEVHAKSPPRTLAENAYWMPARP